MKSTFKVLFYLKKNSENKGKELMIMARITIDGKICQFSTKQKVSIKDWSVKMGKVTGRSTEANEINNLLENIKTSLYAIYNNILRNGDVATPEKVKEIFFGHTEKAVTILELFKSHNDDYKTLVGISRSLATYQKYELTMRNLAEFISYKYKVSDIAVKDINPAFVNGFDLYLRTICRCANNTTAKFMQRFKHIVILAKDNAIIQADPFVNYKMSLEKVDRGYLTEEEVATITRKELSCERLEQVRDIFIFSCFTVLSLKDISLKNNLLRSVKCMIGNDLETTYSL